MPLLILFGQPKESFPANLYGIVNDDAKFGFSTLITIISEILVPTMITISA